MPMTEPQPPSPDRLPPPLVVAITARALFHMEDSHALFEREGIQAFAEFQRQREDDVLPPGIAFPLVRKLLALNAGAPADAPRVEVILLSRNSSDTGLRVFNSIQHHGLDTRRANWLRLGSVNSASSTCALRMRAACDSSEAISHACSSNTGRCAENTGVRVFPSLNWLSSVSRSRCKAVTDTSKR